MDDKVTRKVVLSILKFLKSELDSGTHSEDTSESLEVAAQCLESAYNVDRNASQARNVPDLVELFATTSDFWTEEPPLQDVSDDNKAKAEQLKNAGNTLMKEDKFSEAIQNYTNAIILNPHNAVYYCNRAAAHSKLNNHLEAIEDCKTAIRLDPTYGKAYGRLGIAYSSLNQHENARNSYLKALQLEPENESYKNNLALTNEALTKAERTSGTTSAQPGAGMANLGGVDLNALMSNPALITLASQMMTNPSMQDIMSGLMNMGGADSNVETLLNVGQQLAQEMQQLNPEFVENLRRHMNNPPRAERGDQPEEKKDN